MILKQVHDTNMRAKGYPERVFSVSISSSEATEHLSSHPNVFFLIIIIFNKLKQDLGYLNELYLTADNRDMTAEEGRVKLNC